MQFDLGVSAIRKCLTPKTITLRGVVDTVAPIYIVNVTIGSTTIKMFAKALLSMSTSYEVGDSVVVEYRSMTEAYILGLASELDNIDIVNEFKVRLGKNTISGTKDGKFIEFTSGDNEFTIKHNELGTTIKTSGVLTLSGDHIVLGNGISQALNCMTICPLQGVHVPTQHETFL